MSQIAYFTEKGQTGNRTIARTAANNPNINDFLDVVVSNLNEQNLELGSEGALNYKMWGYFRFFKSDGLL